MCNPPALLAVHVYIGFQVVRLLAAWLTYKAEGPARVLHETESCLMVQMMRLMTRLMKMLRRSSCPSQSPRRLARGVLPAGRQGQRRLQLH